MRSGADEEPKTPRHFDVDDRVLAVIRPGSTLLCVVADTEDHDLERAQQATLELAVHTGSDLLLYDRSEETWGESDHSHRIDVSDVDLDEAPYLAAPLEAARTAHVDVAIWRSIIPTIATGIVNAIQNGGADVVVVPETGGVNTITDWMLEGGHDLVTAIHSVLDKPVAADADVTAALVVVTGDDEVRLV